MGDIEKQDSTNQSDDQPTGEAEDSGGQGSAPRTRVVEDEQGSAGAPAPGDDDIIIK